MNIFGDYLKQNRESKRPKISMRELARRTNVDPSYISRIEKGEYVPSREIVMNIAKALNENVNEFLMKAGYVPLDSESNKKDLHKETIQFSEKDIEIANRIMKKIVDKKIPQDKSKVNRLLKMLDAMFDENESE